MKYLLVLLAATNVFSLYILLTVKTQNTENYCTRKNRNQHQLDRDYLLTNENINWKYFYALYVLNQMSESEKALLERANTNNFIHDTQMHSYTTRRVLGLTDNPEHFQNYYHYKTPDDMSLEITLYMWIYLKKIDPTQSDKYLEKIFSLNIPDETRHLSENQ